nr:hypothetical protein [Thermoleophilaceae bacterium]
PPPGLTYERVTGPAAEQAADAAAKEGLDRSDVSVRRLLRNGTPVAAVLFFSNESPDLDDTAEGFRDAGGTIGDEEIEGERVLVGRSSDGAHTGFADAGDALVTVATRMQPELGPLMRFYAGLD